MEQESAPRTGEASEAAEGCQLVTKDRVAAAWIWFGGFLCGAVVVLVIVGVLA